MNYFLVFLASLALTVFFLWLARRHDDDDAAAGVVLGPDAQLTTPPHSTSAWPSKHFISVCMYCHHVTRTNGHPVRVGDELRVSHGICPACMAAKHPEAAHLAASLAHA